MRSLLGSTTVPMDLEQIVQDIVVVPLAAAQARLHEDLLTLSGESLLWMGLIFVCYRLSLFVRQAFPDRIWSSPIICASFMVGAGALVSGVDFDSLDRGGAPWMWLLVPATAAMAIPVFDHRQLLRQHLHAVLAAIIIGSIVAVGSAVLMAYALGASQASLLALAPKSVTTPIAVGVGMEIGAPIGVVACLVIVTGLIGIAIGPALFRKLGWRDLATQGIAYGLAAHAIGTADAWRQHARMGSFAALALGINGLLTGLVLPTIISWFYAS